MNKWYQYTTGKVKRPNGLQMIRVNIANDSKKNSRTKIKVYTRDTDSKACIYTEKVTVPALSSREVEIPSHVWQPLGQWEIKFYAEHPKVTFWSGGYKTKQVNGINYSHLEFPLKLSRIPLP